MVFKKGHKRVGGRVKGTPNHATVELRSMILGSLAALGGQKYLEARGRDPDTAGAYLTLVGRTLPKEITGEGGGPVIVQVVTGVPPKESKP